MDHTGTGAMPAHTLSLDRLPKGQWATVVALHAQQQGQAMVLRLMEIGFLPGEQVRVLASGFASGDPLAVRVGQATFALRRHEAALVQVQPELTQQAPQAQQEGRA